MTKIKSIIYIIVVVFLINKMYTIFGVDLGIKNPDYFSGDCLTSKDQELLIDHYWVIKDVAKKVYLVNYINTGYIKKWVTSEEISEIDVSSTDLSNKKVDCPNPIDIEIL